jgi:hypothetical protein
MSKPKFSLADCSEDPCFFEDGGPYLDISARLAGLFQRPDLAERIDRAFNQFINRDNEYDVIPLPVIRELYDTLGAIETASGAYLDSHHDLLPEATGRITPDNEDLFEISRTEGGGKVYHAYASIARMKALNYYFQQALERNKEIEYGKYT